jgi:hypothetical protein
VKSGIEGRSVGGMRSVAGVRQHAGSVEGLAAAAPDPMLRVALVRHAGLEGASKGLAAAAPYQSACLENPAPTRRPSDGRPRGADWGHYPTAPSICSSISRFSSRAYSIGSSRAIGSTKPRTIIAIASSSSIPRLIR